MRVRFDELFDLNPDKTHVTPKREIRLGAIKLQPGEPVNSEESRLGVPLETWEGKEFEVFDDSGVTVIQRVYLDDSE